tara:strand:+ start:388 stop:1758 length:1371 start_codon:yes stop_codon:yes gene_type:complete
MLHGYKKSRYNIYDNLEFLGLNPYELKHFCFGESGDDGAGDDAAADYYESLTNPEAVAAMAAVEEASRQAEEKASGRQAAEEASRAQTASLSQAQRDAANQMSLADPTLDVAFNLDPSIVDRESLNELQQNYFNMLDDVAEVDPGLAQNLLDARSINTARYGIYNPEAMNKLEKRGLKTFGLGYRGRFEALSPGGGLSREDYDPNSLTGAGTDEASTNKALFAEFAKENPSLTTVEALTEYNAMTNPDSQLSISDVQSMGFDLNAAVGPQADFREAAAQKGLAQGIGFLAQTAVTGSPIGVISDIALSGTGKGVLGHTIDAVEKATGFELPELPDIGISIPSYQETAVDFFGPAQDLMDPSSFGISPSSATGVAAPTDADIGFTGPTDVYDYGFDGPEQIAPPPVEKPVIKEKEEVIETPAPSFPVRDTTPPSRISRIANIYNISEDAAKRMLGVA